MQIKQLNPKSLKVVKVLIVKEKQVSQQKAASNIAQSEARGLTSMVLLTSHKQCPIININRVVLIIYSMISISM